MTFTNNASAYVDLRGRVIDPHAIVAIHSRALFALRALLEATATRGILVAPVKGALTARWLYRSVSERPISDVDLRVEASSLPELSSIAQQNHWKIIKQDPIYRALELEVEGVSFDIETHFGAPGMSALAVEAALARGSRTDALLGAPYCRLALCDHALLLALNVLKDRVGQCAPWAIEDLVRVARDPAFDPRAMATLAWSAANASALSAIASWLDETREAPQWGSVARALGAVPRAGYAARVREKLAQPNADSTLERAERRLLSRAASDRPEQRLYAVATMARWATSNALYRTIPRAR